MGHSLFRDTSTPFSPSHEQILDLIARARQHPLGIDYLLNGYLDSVAATFQVHALVVDDARQQLTGHRGPAEPLL